MLHARIRAQISELKPNTNRQIPLHGCSLARAELAADVPAATKVTPQPCNEMGGDKEVTCDAGRESRPNPQEGVNGAPNRESRLDTQLEDEMDLMGPLRLIGQPQPRGTRFEE